MAICRYGACDAVTINGVYCHETGCPEKWRDYTEECDECGCDFKPEERYQGLCPDCSADRRRKILIRP